MEFFIHIKLGASRIVLLIVFFNAFRALLAVFDLAAFSHQERQILVAPLFASAARILSAVDARGVEVGVTKRGAGDERVGFIQSTIRRIAEASSNVPGLLMTTNYDPIAEQYMRSKRQPWRTFVECFTLLELIGDPQEQAVLDMACGEGFYTRMIRERGAARVVGVDLSQGMIELARSQEAQHQLGIEYVVGDARELSGMGQFDLVVAAYLLNYARNRDELQSMCDGIARSLRPGGRFVAVNCNPSLFFPAAPSYRKYGFETSVLGEWQEGAPIKWTFYLSDGPFDIENYYLSVATHEEAFRQASFQTIRWHAPRLSPEGLLANDQQFWSSLLNHPPMIFIECIR